MNYFTLFSRIWILVILSLFPHLKSISVEYLFIWINFFEWISIALHADRITSNNMTNFSSSAVRWFIFKRINNRLTIDSINNLLALVPNVEFLNLDGEFPSCDVVNFGHTLCKCLPKLRIQILYLPLSQVSPYEQDFPMLINTLMIKLFQHIDLLLYRTEENLYQKFFSEKKIKLRSLR